MPEIELDGEKVPYQVRISSKASKPRIDSKLEGIRVVLPEDSEHDHKTLVQACSDWVLEKYNEKSDFLEKVPEKQFEDGEKFLYLGENLTLRTDMKNSEIAENEIHVQSSDPRNVEEEVRQIYRDKAREIFTRKVEKYNEYIDGEYNEIQVRNQRTLWGNCTAKNNLSFNWRIMMAPEFVSEYLAVHELVHLEYPNHTEKFWKRVNNIFSRYEEAEKWINENKHKLAFSQDDMIKNDDEKVAS